MVHVHSSQHVKQILAEHAKSTKPPTTPSTLASSGLSFVVRKRPLLKTEKENGDFDVVDTPAGYSSAVVLYEASILADRKTRDLKAHLFRVDHVFPPDDTSDEFYLRVGQPLVMTAIHGGDSALLSMGSQGSGKSYTISEVEERAAYDIFADVEDAVFLEYVEFRGNQCIDLLGPMGSFVSLVPSEGKYRFNGAVKESITSAEEMLAKISNAKRRFATHSHVRQRMEVSSYLLCRITINDRGNTGTLLLLEAGTDKIKVDGSVTSPITDIMYHIRCMISDPTTVLPSTNHHNLMKILKPVLESETSKLCVVGNVSPASMDTEVTLSTLLTLKKTMKGNDQGITPSQAAAAEESLVLPRQWTNDQLVDFLRRKRYLEREVAPDINGRLVMRMSKRQLQDTFFRGKTASEKAEKLFIGLRAENDRIARLRVKKRLLDQKK
jgi:Kinesin motor domain